jgi:HD-like signal output (HDOD) protein
MTARTSPQALAAEVSSLFTLPDLVVRAMEVMNAPTSTAQDLVEVIELDAGLAATVLRLANSALYGQQGSVDTLSRAVALIGTRALRDLVLATSVVKTFKDIPAEFVDMDTFWDSSITCGILARLIAGYLRIRESESLFLAGVLHGVGRLVWYVRRPAEYREVLRRVRDEDMPLLAAEQAVFGCSHARVGAALLQAWQLPEMLCLAVGHQLDPGAVANFHKEVALLHLAAQMAANLAPCLKTDQEAAAYIPDEPAREGMRLLGLTPAMLEEIRLEALTASLEIIEILHPSASIIF